MRGYIKITSTPNGSEVGVRCKVSLTRVNILGKKILLKVFLEGIELSTADARVLLDVLDEEKEEVSHEDHR